MQAPPGHGGGAPSAPSILDNVEAVTPDQLNALLQHLSTLPEEEVLTVLRRCPQLFGPMERYLQSLADSAGPDDLSAAGAEASLTDSSPSVEQLERDSLALVGQLVAELDGSGPPALTPELHTLLGTCRTLVAHFEADDEAAAAAAAAPAAGGTTILAGLAQGSDHLDLLATQHHVEELLQQCSYPAPWAAFQRELQGLQRDLNARIAQLTASAAARQRLQAHVAEELARLPFEEEVSAPGSRPPSRNDSDASGRAASDAEPAGCPLRPFTRKDNHLQAWINEVELSRAANSEPGAASMPREARLERSPAPSGRSSPGSTVPADHSSKEEGGSDNSRPANGPPVAMRLTSDAQGILTVDTEPANVARSGRAAALPGSYLVNTVVAMDENDVQEFKDYNLRSTQGWEMMKAAVRRTLNSFLNRSGGRIFFGITDNGLVKGLPLDKKQRDALRLEWDGIINNMWPQVGIREVDYTVRFIEVRSPTGDQLKDRDGTPFWVPVISIEEDPNLREMGVYFTDTLCRDAFTRASASCQRMSWQLVQDRVRRANQYRESKGIHPIDLSDRHYSQYEIWSRAEPASRPPAPGPSTSATVLAQVKTPVTVPAQVKTPVAQKQPTDGGYPDPKRPRCGPAPLSPVSAGGAQSSPAVLGGLTQEQERQRQQFLQRRLQTQQLLQQAPPPPAP
eukprot:EG_transcript_5605